MKQMDFCTVASPFWIEHLMSSVMFRFAVSSAGYLVQSNEDAKSLLGDSYALRGFAHHLSPHGSLDIPPILQCLLDALAFRGHFEELGRKIPNYPTLSFLGTLSPTSLIPGTPFKLQIKIMHVLQPAHSMQDIPASISVKLRVTLGDELFDSFSFALAGVNWLPKLKVA